MEIVAYEPALAEGVTACLNRVTAGLPHYYPRRPDQVAAEIEGRAPDRQRRSALHDDRAWVALDGGAVLGFLHGAVKDPCEDAGPCGALRFLVYEPGHREAGQALLGAAEAWFAEQALDEVIACHQNHVPSYYHLPHAYLSDRLNHVHALLQYNGYARCAGEVYYDWLDFEVPETGPMPVEAELRVEVQERRAERPGLALFAFRGDTRIAQCWFVSCGEVAPGTEAEDWCLTTWLHIETAWQGRRLGMYMLFRALREMRGLGFRHAVISTSLVNYRAQLFYANCGYRTSDWTYGLTRSLSRRAP